MVTLAFRGARGRDAGPTYAADPATWAAFSAWAERLPADGFPSVRRLASEGKVVGTSELATQLRRALRGYSAPTDVAYAARSMLRLLGDGHADETATLIGDRHDAA